MKMTKGDICKEYRAAKRKKAQIQILAELNNVSPDYIKEILKEGGVWQNPGPKPKAKLKAKAAIINPDFEEAVNEMIEQSKEQQRQDALVEAAHYALESIEAKIIETERLIEEIEQKLKRLQEIKRRTQKALGETEATSTDASL